jgi:hypothetical protein
VRKSLLTGCVVFALAVTVTGCGPKAEDKLIKDKIEVFNSMTAEYEKVTDRASLGKIAPEIKSLGDKMDKIDKEFAVLPKEAQDAALLAHKADLDNAMSRCEEAKRQAGSKARKG